MACGCGICSEIKKLYLETGAVDLKTAELVFSDPLKGCARTTVGNLLADLFTVNAGTTAPATDDSLGTASVGVCETLHFWSPNSTIDFIVTEGSAIVGVDVDLSSLPAPVSVVNSIDFKPTSNANEFTVEVVYTNDAGVQTTITDTTPVVFPSDYVQYTGNNTAPTGAPPAGVDTAVLDNGDRYDWDGSNWILQGGPCSPEMTRGALLALRNGGNLKKDCHYVITDYNRGTVGAAKILLHAVDESTVSHQAHVLTTFDARTAWDGRYDLDTGRIYDLRDNRGNYIRGDVGNEVEAFPWGNASVYGNDFHSVTLAYTAGTLTDNHGHLSTIQLNVGNIQNSSFDSQADVRIDGGTRVLRTQVGSNARVYSNDGSGGEIDYCVFEGNAYFEHGGIIVERSTFGASSDVRTRGSAGRIDTSEFGESIFYVRNTAALDVDGLRMDSGGRVYFDDSFSLRINGAKISSLGLVQRISGAPALTLTSSTIESVGYIRMYNDTTLSVTASNIRDNGRIDINNGSHVVTRLDLEGQFVRFWDDSDDCLVDYSHVKNNGYIDFRGESDGRVHKCTVDGGYISLTNSDSQIANCVVQNGNSYIIVRDSSPPINNVTINSYGRMLVQTGRTGSIIGVSITSTAYVRLTGGAGILRHSNFRGYYYHYCTGQTGIHQGLDGTGRQTYTAPATALTGTPVKNY